MITAKVVFIFSQGRWGWTEVYYYFSAGGTLADAEAAGKQLSAARVPLLSGSVSLEAMRVSDVFQRRSSLLDYTLNGGNPNGSGVAQEPWEAAMLDMQATDPTFGVFKRKLMLRGIPAAWNTWTSGAFLTSTLNPNFVTALNAFGLVLTNPTGSPGQWCIRVVNRDPSVNPRTLVTNVSIAAGTGNFQVVVIAPPLPLALGQRVHVYGAKGVGTKGLNADAYIIGGSQVAGWILSSKAQCIVPFIQLEAPAYLSTRVPAYVPIARMSFDRFVKRDTGRPFFGTRGARRTSKC